MRFLQVGLGSMGKRRIRCVHALRAGDVIGYDSRPERRAEAARLYGIDLVSSFEEGMAALPDAVIVSTWPHQHVAYGLAALGAGVPFFAEETIMLEPEALTPLIEACDRYPGIVAAPSCTMRFHPAVKHIREVLERGDIGRVMSLSHVCVSYLPEWHPWEGIQDYYVRSRESGGGREMVPFELDWLEWLFGEVQAVSAEAGKLAEFPGDIDDTFQLLCRFAGGVRGAVTVSVACRVPGRVAEIWGHEGQILWDDRTHEVRTYTAADGKWQHFSEVASREHSYDRMYIEELEHFLQAVRGEVTYGRTFHDVRRMLEVLCAVEQSASEGRRIVTG